MTDNTSMSTLAANWKIRLVDVAERVGSTFAQSAIAVYFVNHGKVDEVTALETAAVAGGLAVLKWLLVVANRFLKNHPLA